MKHIIANVPLIVALAFCQPMFGQGQANTNLILRNIGWTTKKIDNDPTNISTITSISTQKDSIEYIAHFSKKDTILKVIRITKINIGTQMIAYYYANNKPIFISLKRNNYPFSGNNLKFSKTVHSFDEVVDTNFARKKPRYKTTYQANYFFYQGKVRYSIITIDKYIRVNNKKDIVEAVKMYNEAKSYLSTSE